MEILPNATSLLKHGKPLPFGVYDGLIAQPFTSFWDSEGPLLARRRRMQRKTWIFFGVYAPDMFAGIAIADAGMVSTAFAYLAVPGENIYVEDKMTLPLGFGDKFDPALDSDWKLGKFSIRSNEGNMHIASKGKLALDIVTLTDAGNGLSFVCPSTDRPFNFTYKNLPMQVQCRATYRGKNYEASGKYGAIDFTKGYPPRETRWNWLSLIGELEDGTPVGINLVDQFNGNIENAAWISGQKVLLGDARFKMQPPYDKNTWEITTANGLLSLTFTPQGARKENLNMMVMKSLFTQPYGKFFGYLSFKGQRMKLTGQGVVEDHYAKW
jgi:hypothetical protein